MGKKKIALPKYTICWGNALIWALTCAFFLILVFLDKGNSEAYFNSQNINDRLSGEEISTAPFPLTYEDIGTVDEFYDWVTTVWLPFFYEDNIDRIQYVPTNNLILGMSSLFFWIFFLTLNQLLITKFASPKGSIQLRQFRVDPGECSNTPGRFQNLVSRPCAPGFTSSTSSESNFGPAAVTPLEGFPVLSTPELTEALFRAFTFEETGNGAERDITQVSYPRFVHPICFLDYTFWDSNFWILIFGF